MALFDHILKRNKTKAAPKKTASVPAPRQEASEKAMPGNYAFGIGVIKAPHITEKAARLSGIRQYVFKVAPGANKNQVKEAVSKRYSVRVAGVNITRIPAKTKRIGKRMGVVPGYTKAVVTLVEGQSIDLV